MPQLRPESEVNRVPLSCLGGLFMTIPDERRPGAIALRVTSLPQARHLCSASSTAAAAAEDRVVKICACPNMTVSLEVDWRPAVGHQLIIAGHGAHADAAVQLRAHSQPHVLAPEHRQRTLAAVVSRAVGNIGGQRA